MSVPHSSPVSAPSGSQSVSPSSDGMNDPAFHSQSQAQGPEIVVHEGRPIRFYFQNVRGLKSKINHIYLASIDCEFDVLILVETWLDDRITSIQLFGEDFVVYRVDRNHMNSNRSVGGGVLIAVRKSLDSIMYSSCTPHIEQVFIIIRLNGSQVFVGAIYLPPEKCHDHVLLTDHLNCIERVRETAGPDDTIVIVGDYNQPNLV